MKRKTEYVQEMIDSDESLNVYGSLGHHQEVTIAGTTKALIHPLALQGGLHIRVNDRVVAGETVALLELLGVSISDDVPFVEMTVDICSRVRADDRGGSRVVPPCRTR